MLGLLDAEGLDSVSVVGHDWGGFTVFLLGIEHPERIERIVNLDIIPPWMPPPRPRHALLPAFGTYAVVVATPGIGPLLMTTSGAFIRTIIRGGSTARHWSHEELDCYADAPRQPARARASSACYRTFITRELPALAAPGRYRPDQLTVDTLLALGGNSPMHRVLRPAPTPWMTIEVIEGAGHFLLEEAPGRRAAAHHRLPRRPALTHRLDRPGDAAGKSPFGASRSWRRGSLAPRAWPTGRRDSDIGLAVAPRRGEPPRDR